MIILQKNFCGFAGGERMDLAGVNGNEDDEIAGMF